MAWIVSYVEILPVEFHDAEIYPCVRVARKEMVRIISKNVMLNKQGKFSLCNTKHKYSHLVNVFATLLLVKGLRSYKQSVLF